MDEEVGRYRARKDRRRWCRGKVGRPHVTDVVLAKAGWLRGRNRGCWRPEWASRLWFCSHQEVCRNCGKILRQDFGRDCPDWTKDVTVFRVKR